MGTFLMWSRGDIFIVVQHRKWILFRKWNKANFVERGHGFCGIGSRIFQEGWVANFAWLGRRFFRRIRVSNSANHSARKSGFLRGKVASYVAKPPRRAACDKAFL